MRMKVRPLVSSMWLFLQKDSHIFKSVEFPLNVGNLAVNFFSISANVFFDSFILFTPFFCARRAGSLIFTREIIGAFKTKSR